jgi:peptidoglycan/LPS O-acetylase OafA/YrhL
LQSIRGLAALTVLLHHSSFLFATSAGFRLWSEVLLNAHAAVITFFVLSGYVLARSLAHQLLNVRNCVRYYIARLFRIYPALWAACVVAIAYAFFIEFKFPTYAYSSWYVPYISSAPTTSGILSNFASVGFELIPPTWSVRIEIIASALIPLFCIAVRRGLGWVLLGVSIALALVAAATGQHSFLMYLPSFVIGTVLWRYQDVLGGLLGRPPALLLSAAVLLFFRRVNPAWNFDIDYIAITPTLVESLAAGLLIVGIVARRIAVLRSQIAVRLGDISYSLYLVHFIVMSALAKIIGRFAMDQDARAGLLMAATLLVSWPLAAVSYAWVEKPGMGLGRKVLAALPPG